VSLLTDRPVKSTVGMTGEVTLQGRVLPIGGLKQKVLAAHAAGLTDVRVRDDSAASTTTTRAGLSSIVMG
jgi:ATP-dependent Lon protease